MKDITTKEFKQILNDSGINFEVFKWEGILNMISGYHEIIAKEARERGSLSVAKMDKDISDKIYTVLKSRGFYDF